jgi:hypothetical protein
MSRIPLHSIRATPVAWVQRSGTQELEQRWFVRKPQRTRHPDLRGYVALQSVRREPSVP